VSALGWIVGSLQERDAALELLRGEGEAEPRDELGFGLLRDALAEAFFPGVTTLQTRAKYFLLVPCIYQEIENARSRVPAARRIRELEAELLERLRGTGERGIIGSQRWRVPQNPASGIYWSGLYTWRIRLFTNTRAHYHRWLDGGRRLPLASSGDDAVTADARWHEPPESSGLLEESHLRLQRDHAEFLRDRILGIRDSQLPASAGSAGTARPYENKRSREQHGKGDPRERSGARRPDRMSDGRGLCHCRRGHHDPITPWVRRAGSGQRQDVVDRDQRLGPPVGHGRHLRRHLDPGLARDGHRLR
jgi:hypothetical protein